MLECVVNISEGRRAEVVEAIADAAGRHLLDLHSDPDHHRSVLTLLGEEAPRAVATAAVETLRLAGHTGAHPRIGVVDVVPFVPLGALGDGSVDRGADLAPALAARERFARWAADELSLPCFLYGPERSLPDVRRGAFSTLLPDVGPAAPHPTAGAVAVGARPVLVAYNMWLAEPDLTLARRLAGALRGASVRALGLQVGEQVQVSMNLTDPWVVGPAEVYDRVAAAAEISRAELVGLVPQGVLDRIDPSRWSVLDLASERTIEARLRAAGFGRDTRDG